MGIAVGCILGKKLGAPDGKNVGMAVGSILGRRDGSGVGGLVGSSVGFDVGSIEGSGVGEGVDVGESEVSCSVGTNVGSADG